MKQLCYLLLLGLLPTTIQAQTTRSLFDTKSIGEIRIKFAQSNWPDQLDSLRIYGDGMLVGDVTVDGTTYQSAGIRYRGDKSYTRGLKRNPFSIKLNHTKQDQNHQGYTAIKISSALRDPSMVREVLFYEIAGKYMPAPKVSYTRMYVNDEYIGVFINVESVDGQFLRRHYGSDDNPFFKAGVDYPPKVAATCKVGLNGSLEYEDDLNCYKANFEMNSTSGWADLQDLTRTLQNDPRNIGRVLDIDRALWMLALNNVMVNLSSYTGTATNYYLYQDDQGRFQPILWDLNLSFGSHKNTGSGSDIELKDLQRLDPMLHADNPYRPLAQKLLSDPLYRKVYLSHMRQIIDENFKNGAYEKRAQELQAMIVIPFSDDKFKTYSMEDFQASLKSTVGRRSKIPGIVELMAARTKFLDDHDLLNSLPSSISDVNCQSRSKMDNKRVEGFRISAKADRFPKRMWLHYRTGANQPFMTVPMDEDMTIKNLPNGVKVYIANVDAKSVTDSIEYYIVSENAGAVSYSPTNYTQKMHKASLVELNK
jgi:CotH kinase protein